jgi:two-component system sensor histidine kinase TctE
VVRGDAMLLATLISNAVGNAVKFGTNVTVRARGEGTTAILEVADDGPGVPRGMRDAVFEPFVRGVGSSVPGSGLGLAVIASVARRHGGEARFRDVPRGAMLEVTLPRLV